MVLVIINSFVSFLIVLGMVGHEVIPHHHHTHHLHIKSIDSSCSDHNDSDCGNDGHDSACSIFEYNPLGNIKLNNIDISNKFELKSISFFSYLSNPLFINNKTSNYSTIVLFLVIKKPSCFCSTFSHRGPPLL